MELLEDKDCTPHQPPTKWSRATWCKRPQHVGFGRPTNRLMPRALLYLTVHLKWTVYLHGVYVKSEMRKWQWGYWTFELGTLHKGGTKLLEMVIYANIFSNILYQNLYQKRDYCFGNGASSTSLPLQLIGVGPLFFQNWCDCPRVGTGSHLFPRMV